MLCIRNRKLFNTFQALSDVLKHVIILDVVVQPQLTNLKMFHNIKNINTSVNMKLYEVVARHFFIFVLYWSAAWLRG